MAIEIVIFPIKNGDFPLFFVCLPEGKKFKRDPWWTFIAVIERGDEKSGSVHVRPRFPLAGCEQKGNCFLFANKHAAN